MGKDLAKYLVQDVKKHAETYIKTMFETLSQKLQQNIRGKLVSNSTLDDFVIKQKKTDCMDLPKIQAPRQRNGKRKGFEISK